MNVVNMNYLDIQNRLREFINGRISIPFDGISPEEMRFLIDLIGYENLTIENMNNYIDQKQKALNTLWEREGLAPVNLGRKWISHPYVPRNQQQIYGYGAPFQSQSQTWPLESVSSYGQDILNNIFHVPNTPPAQPENFIDNNAISYKMKDVLTYNEYEFLSNIKIVEISNKKDIIKTINLLQKLIDQKVFDEPCFEDALSILSEIPVEHSVSNEAKGYTIKVIIDGDDDSSARFAMVDVDNNEVDPIGQRLPDSRKIYIDHDVDKAYGPGMVPYDIIHK